jgi:hypothetical protein
MNFIWPTSDPVEKATIAAAPGPAPFSDGTGFASDDPGANYTNGRVEFGGKVYSDIPTFFDQYSQEGTHFEKEALRGVQERTPLSDRFFSDANQEYIQNNIRYFVWLESGKQFIISPQSPQELQIIMRSLYFQYVKHTPSIPLDSQVQYLNGLVVKECVNIILTNIRQFMGFSQDA